MPVMAEAAREIEAHVDRQALFETALRLGDTALILAQQVSGWTSKGPTVELDIALQNHALDMIGQARMFLDLAGRIEGRGRDEDRLAYFRDAPEFRNLLIAETENGDFGQTILRQWLFAEFAERLFARMKHAPDAGFAAIAEKAEKEMAYQARHCGEWVVRLGDGTDESHARMAAALAAIWPFTHEMFEPDETERMMAEAGILPDLPALKEEWLESVESVLERATLSVPEDDWRPTGGKQGRHTERLSYIVGEMQVLARAHPEAKW